jgi:arabinose-5-phosphate isomerase
MDDTARGLTSVTPAEPLGSREEVFALARRTLQRDARAVSSLIDQLDDRFLEAVDLLFSCRGKVLVTGLGTSGATARRVAHLLSVGGTPAVFVHAADGLHGGLGSVAAGDCIFAISKGGETKELNEYARLARERGATVLSLTSAEDSPLARLSDVALTVETPDDVDPGGMIAMGSALAACAIGDALVVTLMELRAYPWADFERSHPGGAVGNMIARRARTGAPISEGSR